MKVVCNMSVNMDVEKGKRAAELLYKSFATVGIHGQTQMPEDDLPAGVEKGSFEHLMFITLTVSIDYQRDAIALWNRSRKTFEDPETRYLFYPELIFSTPASKIISDMQKYKLSQKMQQDAFIWRTVALTFYKKWEGNPMNFLVDCMMDSPTILQRLKNDWHYNNNKKMIDFPFLRGDKIGPLWLRMLRDNVGISDLKNLDKVPIPVDIHVARSSLALGIIRGRYEGRLVDLFSDIRRAWAESVKGLSVKDRDMIALDIDEPLWHLSKYGCAERDKESGYCRHARNCEMKEFCIEGKINIEGERVEINT